MASSSSIPVRAPYVNLSIDYTSRLFAVRGQIYFCCRESTLSQSTSKNRGAQTGVSIYIQPSRRSLCCRLHSCRPNTRIGSVFVPRVRICTSKVMVKKSTYALPPPGCGAFTFRLTRESCGTSTTISERKYGRHMERRCRRPMHLAIVISPSAERGCLDRLQSKDPIHLST